MLESEVRRFIQEEIKRQLNVILPAVTGNADSSKESIEQMFPGMPTVEDRPVMQPFGLSSVAPKGTSSVIGRMGEHFGNRFILGHRDSSKPSDITHGETVLYDAYGGKIELKKSTIKVEKNGEELFEILVRFLTTIINARTNTIFGPQPLIPDPSFGVDQTFIQIKTDLETMKGGG